MKIVIYPINKRSVTAGDIGRWAKQNGCDLVAEWHFNAVDNPAALGYETLTDYGQRDGQAIKDIHKTLVNFGWRDRGIKPCNGGGGRSLQNPRLVRNVDIQYMLIELCFISNPNDMAIFDRNIVAIPKAVIETAKRNGVKTLGIVYGHGGNDVGAVGVNGRQEAKEVRRLDFLNINTKQESEELEMSEKDIREIIRQEIVKAVKESEVNAAGQKDDHWSEKPFQELQKRGIKFHERRFNDFITRGEVFQVIFNLVAWIESNFKPK